MSETNAQPRDTKLLLEQQLAQVTRDRQEAQKLIEEARKFLAETMKLQAEALKLEADAMKRNRDRGLAPWLAVGGSIGGLLTITDFALRVMYP